ncbi:ParA family protein [Merismopedia glauca]|uniref:Cobyrinic acid a,c-diamide synthase n=1 Tax=Merismopedia glauca CCAP 1448/3 TaxID=1296344 RepID=A0A2T1C9C0_9CYAN|nr:ParA family protein [Merismopedia glauca]PSB04758.1 cobyrinic acid a,c-diamide synthase [Merismopedia glauca CCAP 1448/3]
MAYVIATANMKGGVGKTTITVNLATCLAKNYGKKVLVFDLDTQISATLSLMPTNIFGQHRKARQTLKQLINQVINLETKRQIDIREAIEYSVCNIKNLDLLPGDIELYDEFIVAEMLHEEAYAVDKLDFAYVWNRFERRLIAQIIEPVKSEYDFIILDCAPGFNLMTRSGLTASDFYILPTKAETLSVIGIQLLERRIAELKKTHEAAQLLSIELLGIVFNMTGNILTGRYHRQVMQRINQEFPAEKIFQTQIPADINVAKAVDSFMPIVLSSPQSASAKLFSQLTQEVLQKI